MNQFSHEIEIIMYCTMTPKVTAVIPTLNCATLLEKCLRSLKMQEPRDHPIEILVVDSGSDDGTLEVAGRFGARVIQAPRIPENQEYQKGMGIMEAQGDMVLLVDSDNALPDPGWLNRRLTLLESHPDVVAVSPLRYRPVAEHSALNRYFALFGANDPVAYYLNKRDRLSWAEDGWPLLGKAQDCGTYILVHFDEEHLPSVGANGFLIRRAVLEAVGVRPETFIDIDINVDIVRSGRTLYAFVKDDIIHETAQTFWRFLAKRYRYMKKHIYERSSIRRWHLVGPRDKWKLVLYCLYAATFVRPLGDSFRGYLKRPDVAWFLHPFVCFGLLVAYGLGVLEMRLRRIVRSPTGQ